MAPYDGAYGVPSGTACQLRLALWFLNCLRTLLRACLVVGLVETLVETLVELCPDVVLLTFFFSIVRVLLWRPVRPQNFLMGGVILGYAFLG